ncbi:MAG: CNP1-like family protein [Thiobacillus sp.]|nr:CNP1-like family protein [Thiobacillus sp.]
MRIIVVFLLGLLAAPASADREATVWGDSYGLGSFEHDFDENAKSWKEIQAQLPPYPKAGNLVEFTVSATTSNRFYIDYNSINVGEDGVVRYSVLIRSPAGAETVNFEGMRCETGERKLYAFGRSTGEWSRNRYAKWELIPARQAASHQRELFFHYLCTVDTAGDLKKIRYAVKHGGVRRGE